MTVTSNQGEAPLSAPYCLSLLHAHQRMNHLPSIFLLKTGRAWQPQALPSGIPAGAPKQCYENAAELALTNAHLTYVEGYACPPGLIPVHHAWCVDRAERVVDPTFRDAAQSQYFGAPLSDEFLRQSVANSKLWGVFAGIMTPQLFVDALADLQAGPWAVPADVEAELRTLLSPFLGNTTLRAS